MLIIGQGHGTEDFEGVVQSIEDTVPNRTLISLSELLREDIAVSLRLRAVEINLVREVRRSYGISGYEVIMFGKLATTATRDASDALPAEIEVAFSPDGNIRRMTIAVADPQALTAAMRNTAHDIGLGSF